MYIYPPPPPLPTTALMHRALTLTLIILALSYLALLVLHLRIVLLAFARALEIQGMAQDSQRISPFDDFGWRVWRIAVADKDEPAGSIGMGESAAAAR